MFRTAAASSSHTLTPRELEILELLAEGLPQKEIARRLVLSSRTVARHIEHILGKLGVHSRAQAVALAYRHGLLGSPSGRDRRDERRFTARVAAALALVAVRQPTRAPAA